MSTIVTRAGKGSALTYAEVDSNFTNLNTDKYQSGSAASLLSLSLSSALSPTSGGTGVNNGIYTITLGGNIATAGGLSIAGAYPLALTLSGTTSLTFPQAGTLATLAGTETLTGKTLSGSSNTFSNIANASLTNSAITINGSAISLGGSATVTANTTNALLFNNSGTGSVSGTTFNGSAAQTISYNTLGASPLAGSSSLVTVGTVTSGTWNASPIANTYLANSALTLGTTSISLGATSTTLAGLLSITLTQDPTSALQAATKQYVDAIVQGLHVHASCAAATPASLASITGGTVTYNNGTAGVGATLTLSVALTLLDGYPLQNGNRILVKNEATQANNGIYTWATGGTVLTRATDFDSSTEIASGDFTFVSNGTLYADTGWVQTLAVATVGTSPLSFTQFSGAGTYTAGTGLTLTGSQFSLTAPVAAALGGTGSTTYVTGDLLYASGTSALSKLGIGASTSILTSTGSAPQWSTPSTISVGAATNVAGGSVGALLYQSGVGSTAFLGIGTNDFVLTVSAGLPSWAANTGTGNVVRANSPTLVTPILGTPQSGNFSTGTFTWPTFNQNTTGSAGSVANAVTFNNSGTGAVSGTTFNGSAAQTISYNTIGAQAAGTYVTSVTGTAPVVSSGGTTPAISMAAATGTVDGYLTSIDWTTFNGKQTALVSGTNIKTVSGVSLLGSGDLGVIGATYGGTGVNNGTRTLTINTNSGSVTFTNAATTLTVANTASVSGTNTGDQTITLTGDVTGSGTGSFATTIAAASTGTGNLVRATGPSISNLTLTGTLTAGGSAGTAGFYLQTTGTGVQWAAVAGGSAAFSALTSGTNTTAAMVVGTGASLAATGTGTITATSVTLQDGIFRSGTLTTSAVTANQVLYSLASASYRSVKYEIQITSGTSYQVTEIRVVHDGTTAYLIEYGSMSTGVDLATFDADINTGNLRLLTTPVNAVTTYKLLVKAINV